MDVVNVEDLQKDMVNHPAHNTIMEEVFNK